MKKLSPEGTLKHKKYLLSKGANPVVVFTRKNGTTHNPSQIAAVGKHTKIVKMLDVAAEVNRCWEGNSNRDGETYE